MDLDIYCNGGTETALHNAVKRRETAMCNKLLQAGADPNLVIYATEETPQPLDEQFYFKVRETLFSLQQTSNKLILLS